MRRDDAAARYALTDARIHAFTARDCVAANTQPRIAPSNVLDKGVAFFLSSSIELAHHAQFFRNFSGERWKNCDTQRSKSRAMGVRSNHRTVACLG